MNELTHTIGKTMEETVNEDWLGFWPIINSQGIIQAILDGEYINDDAIMVDWENGKAVEVDGFHGFDAILRII